jgi:hypothetical protein
MHSTFKTFKSARFDTLLQLLKVLLRENVGWTLFVQHSSNWNFVRQILDTRRVGRSQWSHWKHLFAGANVLTQRRAPLQRWFCLTENREKSELRASV